MNIQIIKFYIEEDEKNDIFCLSTRIDETIATVGAATSN